MKYLHTMVRITNIEKSLDFNCNKLGLKEVKRNEKKHSIEDMNRLITCIKKLQRLSEEANATLNNLEDSFMNLLE